MKATDRDSGTNAVIKYRFSPEESAFVINETTGVVTVNGSLDRETKANYTLSVNASDGVHFCTANLSIILIDVNDNPPVFNQTNLPGRTASCVSLCLCLCANGDFDFDFERP